MRKLIAAALAASALVGGTVAIATPASAQPYGYWHRPHYRHFYGPRRFYGPRFGYRRFHRGFYGRPYYRHYGHRWHRW